MKRMLKVFIILFTVFCATALFAQQQYKLTSEKLNNEGKKLDQQYETITQKMEKIVSRYDLLNTKNISVVPYQVAYNIGDNYLELEKHNFIKSDFRRGEIVGIRTKSIKIYTNGSKITKIESKIYERHYYSGDVDIVTLIDPSPTSGGTDDIRITHQKRGRKLMNDKKMKDVKNTTAFPIRNDMKRMFLIPHISIFNNYLVFIAESYYGSLKDVDNTVNNFLKKSTKY